MHVYTSVSCMVSSFLQCATHINLGWRIKVVDSVEEYMANTTLLLVLIFLLLLLQLLKPQRILTLHFVLIFLLILLKPQGTLTL